MRPSQTEVVLSVPPHTARLKGLYIILDPSACPGRSLVDILAAATDAGARWFQYRDKTGPMLEAYRLAVRLRQATADAGAALIINDRCDLALAVEADGVHLGQRDLPLSDARAVMGTGKFIGISTHSLDQVDKATRGGADYLGFGPIFDTGTKADHQPIVGLDELRRVRPRTHLPIFAIGGLTGDTAARTVQAGADGVAVISAVATAADVGRVVRELLAQLA